MRSAHFTRFFAAIVLFAAAAFTPLFAQNGASIYAAGLDGPRGLKFGPDGALYVAEAGSGGVTPSASSNCPQASAPVGPYFGGPSARIPKITGPGQVTAVVAGLPSGKSSLPSGDTQGVADVAFVGNELFALLA